MTTPSDLSAIYRLTAYGPGHGTLHRLEWIGGCAEIPWPVFKALQDAESACATLRANLDAAMAEAERLKVEAAEKSARWERVSRANLADLASRTDEIAALSDRLAASEAARAEADRSLARLRSMATPRDDERAAWKRATNCDDPEAAAAHWQRWAAIVKDRNEAREALGAAPCTEAALDAARRVVSERDTALRDLAAARLALSSAMESNSGLRADLAASKPAADVGDEAIAHELSDALHDSGAVFGPWWPSKNRDKWTAAVTRVVRPILAALAKERDDLLAANRTAERMSFQMRDRIAALAKERDEALRGASLIDKEARNREAERDAMRDAVMSIAVAIGVDLPTLDGESIADGWRRWSSAVAERCAEAKGEATAREVAEVDLLCPCGHRAGSHSCMPPGKCCITGCDCEADRAARPVPAESPLTAKPETKARYVVVEAHEVKGRPAEGFADCNVAEATAKQLNKGDIDESQMRWGDVLPYEAWAIVDTAPPPRATAAGVDALLLTEEMLRDAIVASGESSTNVDGSPPKRSQQMARDILRHLGTVALPAPDRAALTWARDMLDRDRALRSTNEGDRGVRDAVAAIDAILAATPRAEAGEAGVVDGPTLIADYVDAFAESDHGYDKWHEASAQRREHALGVMAKVCAKHAGKRIVAGGAK